MTMPQIAHIREEECIGCAKCIQACPVDAIIGSLKQMHSVFETECIGCELCVAPCPVDCIDMVPADTHYQVEYARERARKRRQRLKQQPQEFLKTTESAEIKKIEIEKAIQRANRKRLSYDSKKTV